MANTRSRNSECRVAGSTCLLNLIHTKVGETGDAGEYIRTLAALIEGGFEGEWGGGASTACLGELSVYRWGGGI